MIAWAGRQDNYRSTYLQRLWDLVYPWLAYFFVAVLVGEVVEDHLMISLISCGLTIPLQLFFMAGDRKTERREAFRLEQWQKTGTGAFLLCFLCGVSVCVVLNHLLIYSGIYDWLEEGYREVGQQLFTGRILLELLVMGGLVPVVEELIFRGLIYRRLRWYLETLPAMLLASLLFAIAHGNWLQGIYAFLTGFIMAFVYERTHSLIAPICIHAGANLATVLLTELPILGPLYEEENEEIFLLLTGGMLLLFALAFYLFHVKVRPTPMEARKNTAG